MGVIEMSEYESLRIKICENCQKIDLFNLNNSTYSKTMINRLKIENTKLKDKLKELKKV